MTPSATQRIERLARRAAGSVRSVPILNDAAVRAAQRVRRSTTARKVISRTFAIDLNGEGGTIFLGSGNVLAGLGLDSLPVVILSLVDTPRAQVPGLLDQVAREQLLTGGFRPVIVLGGDDFAQVRRFGWPVEMVIAKEDWTGEWAGAGDWETYLDLRLQEIRRDYRACALVPLAEDQPLTVTFLRSLGPPAG